MSGTSLQVTKNQYKPGIFILELNGFIGNQAEIPFTEAAAHFDTHETLLIAFNFSRVEGMDGSGLQSLVIFLMLFNSSSCRLTAFGVSPGMQRVFELTGLDRMFKVYVDEQEALLLHPQAEPVPFHDPSCDDYPPLEGWAVPVKAADCTVLPASANKLNAHGRQPLPPFAGFGALWQRTYRAALPGVDYTPTEVVEVWKDKFSQFWPTGNELFTPPAGFIPGAPVVIHLSLPARFHMATGAMVMHSGADSFTLMTLSGHMFCGWITFSSYRTDQLYVQTQALLRPGDPLYEISYRTGFGARAEDHFWHASLANIARHFGAPAEVGQVNRLVHSRLQWNRFGNLWYNAGVRSFIYQVGTPFQSTQKS